MDHKARDSASDGAAASGERAARPALGDAIRLRVLVWPPRDGQGWRAELRVAGATQPLRFERPLDLVVYLTALPGGASETPGLR